MSGKADVEKAIQSCPEYLYTTVPKPGDVRYVFQDKVCIGIQEAYVYATSLALRMPTDDQS